MVANQRPQYFGISQEFLRSNTDLLRLICWSLKDIVNTDVLINSLVFGEKYFKTWKDGKFKGQELLRSNTDPLRLIL